VALAGLWLAGAPRAYAHAGPQVRGVLTAADGGRVLLANRGLMFEDAGGWRLLCNEALGVTTSELPDLVALPGPQLMAATSHGLLATRDGGCSWQGVPPFEHTVTTALVQGRQRLYLGAYGAQSGLYASDDGGASWDVLLAGQMGDNFRSLRIAPGDPARLYARKLSLRGAQFVYALLRSRDGGGSWQSFEVEVRADETELLLLGVSPADPDLLLARAQSASGGPERLLVSRDAGEHWQSPSQLRAITAAAWSADGQDAWVASDDGLYRSRDGARTFERVGPASLVSCVQPSDQGLLVCGYDASAPVASPGVLASTDGGETLQPYMTLRDVTQAVQCDADAPSAVTCSSWWADWQREILAAAPSGGAAGSCGACAAPAAGRSAAAGGGAAASAAGGCSVQAGTSSAGWGWGAVVLLLRTRRPRRFR
jgi:hypothetical protein